MFGVVGTAISWIKAMTEDTRGKLAWKLYPEQSFYFEAVRRIAEIEENARCVKALEEADSACSGWAVSTIQTKFVSVFWDDLKKDFETEEYKEYPF